MIIHADMDAYYASVEIRERPELADKPVAVGGAADQRGVISAANYVARQYGVHSALPTATAKQLCPDLILLPGRMDLYARVSQQIHHIFARYTPLIEPLSLDEAFLDCRASEKLFGTTERIGRRIKQDIKNELDLVVSIGIAPTKFIAKIASDIDKPNGFRVVREEQVQAFLDPLPVTRLWGVGKATQAILQQHDIHSIAQLRQQDKDWILQRLGKHGEHLWQLAHGIDPRAVIPEREAKSISHETTFARDINNRDVLLAQLLHLTEQVAWRLRHNEYQGRTVHLKIRFADFKTITRSQTLPEPSANTDIIWQAARELFSARLPKPLNPVRLIGISVSGFDTEASNLSKQVDMFTPPDNHRDNIDKLSDSIKERFGSAVLQRGRTLKR